MNILSLIISLLDVVNTKISSFNYQIVAIIKSYRLT